MTTDVDPLVRWQPASPPGPAKRPSRSPRRGRPRRQHRWGRIVLVVVIVALVPVGWSYGHALTAPGSSGTGIRSVEWVRSHGGAGIVAWAENVWYSHHAPPKGGRPAPGLYPGPVHRPTPTTVPQGPAHLAAPAPIAPIASPPLPGEGTWHPIGRTVQGVPAVYAAYLRPDAVHTSLVTGVAWMDTTLLRARLFAGSQEPGGPPWPYMAPIPAALQTSLVAAFNSGFKLQDARGGYYSGGRTAVPLVKGAASLVIRQDGTATVAQWGRDASMGPGIVSVRQNLTLIVDGGQPVPGLATGSFQQWGATLGNKVLVWRSGVGVTADGALVYAGGNGLSISSLAEVLARAGAVRAMELDINSEWVDFYSFAPASGQPAQPANGTKLVADMDRSPSRYFEPSERDFIAMFAR